MTESISRRSILKTGAGLSGLALAAPFIVRRAWAAEGLTVADPGGPYSAAYGEAFYRPFEKETGIKINNVSRDTEPVAQFKAMVQTKSFIWDVCTLAGPAYETLGSQGLLHDMKLNPADYPDFLKNSVKKDWMGIDVFSCIAAYRTDHFKSNVPRSMTDFFDVQKFPARRAMYKAPVWTLEQALLADGVAPASIYPLNVDRAFKKLDTIKPHVTAWWTSGAQSAQLLQSAEVEFTQIFNARSQALTDEKVPVATIWDQGIYGVEGWGIPAGVSTAGIGTQFVRFCADPARQAQMTRLLAYGPTNTKAYEKIPAERAAVLPTFKDNVSKMIATDEGWWLKNRAEVQQRFNEWVLT